MKALNAIFFLLLSSGMPVNAVLIYDIFEANDNLEVETSGFLNLPPWKGDLLVCPQLGSGSLSPPSGLIYVCSKRYISAYPVIGPSAFTGTAGAHSDIAVGLANGLSLGPNKLLLFGIDPAYIPGDPIISKLVFYNKTLTDFGLPTSPGTIASWSLKGSGDKIKVSVKAAPVPAPVPAPLGALSLAVAFKTTRKIRYRLRKVKDLIYS